MAFKIGIIGIEKAARPFYPSGSPPSHGSPVAQWIEQLFAEGPPGKAGAILPLTRLWFYPTPKPLLVLDSKKARTLGGATGHPKNSKKERLTCRNTIYGQNCPDARAIYLPIYPKSGPKSTLSDCSYVRVCSPRPRKRKRRWLWLGDASKDYEPHREEAKPDTGLGRLNYLILFVLDHSPTTDTSTFLLTSFLLTSLV